MFVRLGYLAVFTILLKRLPEQKTAINLYMAERGGIEVPTANEWVRVGLYHRS